MSYYFNEVYSHPKILLQDHLLNVANNSHEMFDIMDINDNSLYSEISFFIGLTHDFAKCTSFFQNHLFNDIHSSKAYHSFLSAIFCYYVLKKFIRRENIENAINFPIIGYLVVKNHHGNLKNIRDEHKLFKENMNDVDIQVEDIKNNDLSSLKNFYANNNIDVDDFLNNIEVIKTKIKKDLREFKKDFNLNNYTHLILFFSVLIDSDKIDASNTEINHRIILDSNMVDKYKQNCNFNQLGINQIREQAYEELINKVDTIDLNNRLYSISLPTGSGKTFAAISFAMKLRNRLFKEKYFLPRIIYSLPFLSIIDQNEEVIKNILSNDGYNSQDIFIKHNSMSEIYYKTIDENELEVDNAELLIESWYSEIIITTFYQLLYTLISNKNRSLKKLHNISNSILILDEVQSIPPKYWKLINVLLNKISKEYNLWIIFMTATQPAIFTEDEMKPLIENKEYYFKQFDRVRYNFNLEKQTIDEFNDYVLDEILSNNKDIMIVVNTIQNSIDIFNYLSNNLSDVELYYLSTNILPFERKERISNIKKSHNRKIIVTTQLIEAGVDIDVDIIYRDFAPIDSIVQTAGRCNRNQEKDKGTVNIIRLCNENGEYNQYIYDSISRETTYELIKDIDTISEKEFAYVIEEYYTKIQEKISKDKSNEILNNLTKLEITNITNEFKLIEEDIKKQEVFIDINEESHDVWEKYNEIFLSDRDLFDKKREFKKIKTTFRKYIISVDEKKLGTTVIEHNMGYVDQYDLEHKYDRNIGFIAAEDEEAFII